MNVNTTSTLTASLNTRGYDEQSINSLTITPIQIDSESNSLIICMTSKNVGNNVQMFAITNTTASPITITIPSCNTSI